MIENLSTIVTLDTHTPASRKFVVKDRDAAHISDRRTNPTRNSLVSLTTLIVFVVVILMLASCATVTEEQKYARSDRLMVALEQYELRAAACKAAGATMMITARATRIKSYKYNLFELQSARCVWLR